MAQLTNHGVAQIKWPYLGKMFRPKTNATLQHGTRKCRKIAEGAEAALKPVTDELSGLKHQINSMTTAIFGK